MEANTKVKKFKNFDVELETSISGSIHAEFIEKQKEMEFPKPINTDYEDCEVVDEVIAGRIDTFIAQTIKKFERESGLSVESYYEPELENVPKTEEETKNLKIKIKLVMQCRLPTLTFNYKTNLI